MVNTLRVFQFSVSSVFFLLLVTVTLAIPLGLIEEKASVTESYAELAGYKAAGAFYISNKDGDLGEIDNQELNANITETGGLNKGCGLDEPGFRKGERLEIGTTSNKCALSRVTGSSDITNVGTGMTAVVQLPIYSEAENTFYSIYIGDPQF